jgi:hypothetical protein
VARDGAVHVVRAGLVDGERRPNSDSRTLTVQRRALSVDWMGCRLWSVFVVDCGWNWCDLAED